MRMKKLSLFFFIDNKSKEMNIYIRNIPILGIAKEREKKNKILHSDFVIKTK